MKNLLEMVLAFGRGIFGGGERFIMIFEGDSGGKDWLFEGKVVMDYEFDGEGLAGSRETEHSSSSSSSSLDRMISNTSWVTCTAADIGNCKWIPVARNPDAPLELVADFPPSSTKYFIKLESSYFSSLISGEPRIAFSIIKFFQGSEERSV